MTWNELNALALRILTRWWIVVIVAGLVTGAAAWRVAGTPATYRATALMVISPSTDLPQSEAMRVADLLNRDVMMATYVDVMSSPRVIGAAMATAGDETTGSLLWPGYQVTVHREPGSNVLRVIAEGPDKSATETLVEHVRLVGEATLQELYPMVMVTPLTSGQPQAEPSGLSVVRVMGIGMVVGVGFGLLVALWFDSLMDYRRRSATLAAPGTTRAPTKVEMGPAGQQVVTPRRP